jgi:hypothetical protein
VAHRPAPQPAARHPTARRPSRCPTCWRR